MIILLPFFLLLLVIIWIIIVFCERKYRKPAILLDIKEEGGGGLITPGMNVKWIFFPKQRDQDGHTPFLTDIVTHLPTYLGNQYFESDRVTWGHETTHGINSHIRNKIAQPGEVGFYCGYNQVAVVSQPKMTLSQIAGMIPQNLRGSRYQLYFVSQAGDWNDTPLYCFDEWVAYTNGAAVGLETPSDNSGGSSDFMIGALEFAIYAICTCMAIDKYDPAFLNNKQFKEYVAHELKRSINIYRVGIVMPQYKWDRTLETNVRANADCAAILNKMYGNMLTMDTLFGGVFTPVLNGTWEITLCKNVK